MKQLLVKRTVTQYVRAITPQGYILWTHDARLALPMTTAKATALALRLQRSADMNGPGTQPPGEYDVQQLPVDTVT